VSEEAADACTLVSASSTTGWFDWSHGELWLCPNGLLRQSLGLATTIAHWNQPTVDPTNRPRRTVGFNDIGPIVARDRRNRWITWREVSNATLKQGFVVDSLHLELGNERREKFLWLRIDDGYDLLKGALAEVLAGRFTAADRMKRRVRP
jgi:hypothetical protein